MKLNKEVSETSKTPAGEKMPELYVGFEFEFGSVPVSDRTILNHYNLEEKRKTTTHYGKDRYEGSNVVVSFYVDGSVPNEIVTRPVLVSRLDQAKEVFDYIKSIGGDMVCNGRAGLHMTFLTDHHKELSKFGKLWVQNIMQLSRMWYPNIIRYQWDKTQTTTRPLRYRELVNKQMVADISTRHYSAVSLRQSYDASKPWGIEIRIPNGTNEWDAVELQVKYWTAIFAAAHDMSKEGLVEFEQKTWSKVEKFFARTSNGCKCTKASRLPAWHLINKYFTGTATEKSYERGLKIFATM